MRRYIIRGATSIESSQGAALGRHPEGAVRDYFFRLHGLASRNYIVRDTGKVVDGWNIVTVAHKGEKREVKVKVDD